MRITVLLALLLASSAASAMPVPLSTESERSGFTRTGRYAEVISLCTAFAQRYPKAVRCIDFGTTPEGRPMKALVVSTSGALTAAQARQRGLPVVLVQGGIHAGEIDGKDAGFLLLRQMLEGTAGQGVLDTLVWVFVPVFNVDGHERFGAWNRPNQRGPEAMGWRTTAANYNLNRDYLKADTAEMQAMLGLVQQWDPLATVDLHVTNGAQFQHDISIQVEPLHAGDVELRTVGRAWRDAVIADLSRQGSLPLPFYPSFVVQDDPASGFEDNVPTPRFSHGYFWLRNRLGMLVETHSWKEYPVRIRATRNAVLSVLEQVATNGQPWLQTAHEADERASSLQAQPVPLTFQPGPESRRIDFSGYAYTRSLSEISGALMTRYDEDQPQIWNIPLRDNMQPELMVTAPGAGYLVPPAHAAWVGQRLQRHGIRYSTLGPMADADVEVFRATAATPASASSEGRQRMTVTGSWMPETRSIGAGALFVPIAQPGARLLLSLLEPKAPDSLLAWGDFNYAFERKEYMEDYVAEQVAREMLAADPALRERFGQQLREDPKFAASPSARLEFFARLHPSWDEQYRLYPVMRIGHSPR